jgi:hypothetical protein
LFKCFPGIEHHVPLCGFSDVEDLKTLSSIGKAFIILSDFKNHDDNHFVEVAKVLSKEGEEISVSFGLIDYDEKEIAKLKKVISEFHKPVIYELEHEDDIEKIVAPTINRSYNFQ